MKDTNRSDGILKVVWEILPGDIGHVFREISQEDFDPSLFSLSPVINTDNFPTLPHPLLNPANDCLDRVWTQTVIKISYQLSEWFDEYEP